MAGTNSETEKLKLQDMDRTEFIDHLKQRFPNFQNQSKKPSSCASTDACVYNFNHPQRGLALVINNEYFDKENTGLGIREGTHFDKNALEKSLGFLGFQVEVFDDLKAWQMRLLAETVASRYNHEEADCFVCAILSHGEETVDNKKSDVTSKKHIILDADRTAVNTEDIVSCFSDKNCPSLIGKPRLFFVQACRGKQMDDGVELNGNSSSTVMACQPNVNKVTVLPSILYPDCLVMYASPPGYYAWRRKTQGSWFIQELCKFLGSEDVGKKSFLRGLTVVMRNVALNYESKTTSQKSNHKKAMPVLETLLSKDIYMIKKV